MQKHSDRRLSFKELRRSLSFAKHQGLLIAILIIGLWCLHLSLALQIRVAEIPGLILIGLVLGQAFLNTGLFITAHDAIHGLVCPTHRGVNAGIGIFCSLAYASLPYKTLRLKHWRHHRDPMGTFDPDFCGIDQAGFLTCYLHFMGQYWGWKQFICLTSGVSLIALIGRLSLLNLGLFWGLPLLLSSLQLFYFGTYRPHQTQGANHGQHHCAKSHALPWLGSFLLCYHFGYHQEHHDHPGVPWWQLPALYQSTRYSSRQSG